jgi:hypothetical protein
VCYKTLSQGYKGTHNNLPGESTEFLSDRVSQPPTRASRPPQAACGGDEGCESRQNCTKLARPRLGTSAQSLPTHRVGHTR